MTQRIYHIDKNYLSSSNFILNTFKVALQHPSMFFLLFNTVFYLKLNFKLKITLKMCIFKKLEKICRKHLATLKKIRLHTKMPYCFLDLFYNCHMSFKQLLSNKFSRHRLPTFKIVILMQLNAGFSTVKRVVLMHKTVWNLSFCSFSVYNLLNFTRAVEIGCSTLSML